MIGVGHRPPVFGKNLFLQVGDPKGFHKVYHEITYTKFGVGRSFCKNDGGGGPRIILLVDKAQTFLTLLLSMKMTNETNFGKD